MAKKMEKRLSQYHSTRLSYAKEPLGTHMRIQKKLLLILCLLSTAVSAWVPPPERLPWDGNQPPVRPVRGPIRPNSAYADKTRPGSRLLPHQQKIFPVVGIKAVFWGKAWNDPVFADEKVRGIDSWYRGYGDSGYAHIVDEYVDIPWIGGAPEAVSYRGHVIDSNPIRESRYQDTMVGDEVCGLIASHKVPLADYYPVYLDRKPPDHHVCGIHGLYRCTSITTSTVRFSYSLIYDLDGVESCDPHDTVTGHSQGLAALANTSARALTDSQTNWDFEGWYDVNGNEIDDKCAWTFDVPFVTFANGTIWKLQGLWSNAAYKAGTGYLNADGQRGCLFGE